jgi:hypothetical protein
VRWLCLIAAALFAGCLQGPPSAAQPAAEVPAERVLFEEPFEDTDWEARGWYDGPAMEITAAEHIEGSEHSCVWHWTGAGEISPAGRGARVHLEPVSSVTLSYYVKHSADWTWTGVGWHPHEFHFITDVDPEYIGPAYTHLTFYVEAVDGEPRVAIQDGMNLDEGRIGEDLVGVTEQRAVAGGNGDSDGYGAGDCYPVEDRHANGKSWGPGEVYFGDDRGPRYKGDWHHVRVRLVLNTVRDGVGQRDGVLQYWYDDEPLMDYRDVVFRTGQHPDMRINQFLMAPYYGPGVPHEQTIWIDDLRITTDEPEGE